MKILVTGGTGFIGSHVAVELANAGQEVAVFSRSGKLPPFLSAAGIASATGSFEDPASIDPALSGTQIVVHAGEIKNLTKRAAERNLAFVRHLLGAMNRAGCTRLVFVSSITVAGIPAATPAKETSEPLQNLQDHYTAYKRSAEDLIRAEAGALEYVILRPAMVYGSGSRVLPRMLRLLRTLGPVGIPWPGNGKALVPLIHVQDLAKALARAAQAASAAGETFNVSDGVEHAWLDLFGALERQWSKRIRILPVPPVLLRLPALALDFIAWPFGIETDPAAYIEYVSRNIHFANDKAKRRLGWKPEYDLERGVAEMLGADAGADDAKRTS